MSLKVSYSPITLTLMSRTIKALSDSTLAEREHELIAAGEVLDLRFRDGRRALSLRAGKLFHLLVNIAGARAVEDVEHKVPIAQLNFSHLERDELVECVRDLVGTTVELRVKRDGKEEVMVDPLLFGVRRPAEMYEDAGNLVFRLSPTLRKVLEQSNHWAALSRKAVLAFESRFSLRLYEIVALRSGLERKTSEVFDLDDLRKRLGVEPKTFTRWQDFRRFVLDRALEEVNQLSGFTVTWEPVKRGRSFAAVRLSWEVQDAKGRAAAARELDSSSIGRRARREGTVENVVEAGFPPAGPISYGKWADIAREMLPRPTPDVDLVATRFRDFAAKKGIPLGRSNIERIFRIFCKEWKV
ncbi:replication initiation protein [Bosea sp. CRIB-10]|uniref:replication initiation protein n=1 Tax=Bosea sp. CRIB-10 TaxID=378404 RepID=UPI0011133B07|nr:replication initiation protein [Bosea sp. CRIB-10]